MSIYIDGIGISGYRSFGKNLQRIGPFKQFNLFAGPNNSGKSNILRFLDEHYWDLSTEGQRQSEFGEMDHCRSDGVTSVSYEFALNLEGDNFKQVREFYAKRGTSGDPLFSDVQKVLASKTLSQGKGVAWFKYTASALGQRIQLDNGLVDKLIDEKIMDTAEWSDLWRSMTRQGSGALREHWVPEVLSNLSPIERLSPPKIDLIPAFREVGNSGSNAVDHSGGRLIGDLASLQHLNLDVPHRGESFERINKFLRYVTGDGTARLEITHDPMTILVQMGGRVLPLTSLGTGIHEVVIIAAEATVLAKQVICIEEPELHLHPILLKKLAAYLIAETENQYFISTHSAHLLDTPEAAIFHVRLEDGLSVVTPAITNTQKSHICDTLGYRASDILQSNALIWVEGPSDRIYLRHWISALDPSLKEGIHYMIMFYGGRLLNHLSADDAEVDEFISMRHINRHSSIMIDSDISTPEEGINATKMRVRDKIDTGPGFAWITQGREIENYVEQNLIVEAIKSVHPQASRFAKGGQFENVVKCKVSDTSKRKVADKIKVARYVTSKPANLDVLDLKKQVTRLVKFIKQSNGLE